MARDNKEQKQKCNCFVCRNQIKIVAGVFFALLATRLLFPAEYLLYAMVVVVVGTLTYAGYEISKFEWSDVEWIRRWDDWHQIAFRPSLVRDPRLLRALGQSITSLETYPSRAQFRTIVKLLGEEFPTRKLRETSILPDQTLVEAVSRVVSQAMR